MKEKQGEKVRRKHVDGDSVNIDTPGGFGILAFTFCAFFFFQLNNEQYLLL